MRSTQEPEEPSLVIPTEKPSAPATAPAQPRISEFEKNDWLPEGIRRHIIPSPPPYDEQTED